MTVRHKHIFEIKVEAVRCPRESDGLLNEMLVRLVTCRNCKHYAGEHGGEYVECLYEGATLRMKEEKKRGVKMFGVLLFLFALGLGAGFNEPAVTEVEKQVNRYPGQILEEIVNDYPDMRINGQGD